MNGDRTRWEFCKVIGLRAKNHHDPMLVYWTLEGEKSEPLWKPLAKYRKWAERDHVAEKMAELGNDGWEIAAAVVERKGEHIIYLKRKRP